MQVQSPGYSVEQQRAYVDRAIADAYLRGQRPENPCLLDAHLCDALWAMCDEWPNLQDETAGTVLGAYDNYMAWLEADLSDSEDC